MSRVNKSGGRAQVFTHEGAPARVLNPEQELRRSVMACMLWEGTFYESGEDIAKRIADLSAKLTFEKVAGIAIEAREKMKLRHVPLLIARALATRKAGRQMGDLLERIIQRPDELTEFLAIYWKDGKRPLAKQVKVGLARAFRKFDEYAMAKYDREAKVKLRDVLFLSHAKPKNDEQAALWKRLIAGEMKTPDTWEVALSGGADKRVTFERLMATGELRALAFLRNLRNMHGAGVPQKTVEDYGANLDLSRVLPFRFISAARAVPSWEPVIEKMMLRALSTFEVLPGKTAIVVDNSGSMHGARVSEKSDIDRGDAACALAILLREICTEVVVVGFGSDAAVIPARRGFALRDAIRGGPGGGTNTATALGLAAKEGYDRIIVITDEQSHQAVGGPLPEARGYFVNVAPYKNGIGYGAWTHLDGWSEAILDYIRAVEQEVK